MTFFVRKKLALGPIRFGVAPRQAAAGMDSDSALSTGPAGEFVRRRQEGFFFGDVARFDAPTIAPAKSISQTPFLSSLKPDGTPRSYGFLALMILGLLLVLLGFSVVATKGKQGWIEVVFGVIFIGIPIFMTAQKRKQLREKEEREREEREALERRNREMLAAFTNALDAVRRERSATNFERLTAERAQLTLPYEIWGPAAKRTLLQIGFEEIAREGSVGAKQVATVLHQVSKAAGLAPEDVTEVERDLYRSYLWHLLADDRLGDAQEQQLRTIQKGLEVWDRDVPLEAEMVEQFRRLRGVTNKTLPRIQCSTQLGFQEYCIHEAPLEDGKFHVTNKRIVVDRKKKTEVPLANVFDLEVDADTNTMKMKTDQKKPLELKVPDAVFTAAIIDLATSVDTRPKGFA